MTLKNEVKDAILQFYYMSGSPMFKTPPSTHSLVNEMKESLAGRWRKKHIILIGS